MSIQKLTVTQMYKVLEAMEILQDCLGDDSTKWLGRLFFLASKEQKRVAQESLDEMNAFYELPIEERLIQSGFKKNKEGNLEKTIEL